MSYIPSDEMGISRSGDGQGGVKSEMTGDPGGMNLQQGWLGNSGKGQHRQRGSKNLSRKADTEGAGFVSRERCASPRCLDGGTMWVTQGTNSRQQGVCLSLTQLLQLGAISFLGSSLSFNAPLKFDGHRRAH